MLLLATQASRQWLVSLICSDPSQASGGCHRSLQLIHLLESDGWHLEPIDPPLPPANRSSASVTSLPRDPTTPMWPLMIAWGVYTSRDPRLAA
jgi:hypothetical protein